MSTKTLKGIISQLETLCAAHKQVNSFYEGDSLVEVYKTNKITHTSVIAIPQTATFNPTDITAVISLSCVDKVLKDDLNGPEVYNNTLLILGDLINYINQNDAWRYARIIGTPTATKINERTLDVVNGWTVSISVRMIKDNGVCNVPISPISPAPACAVAVITDSDGVSTFNVASGGTGACTLATVQAGIAYNRTSTSGQITSYRTGDCAWREINLPFSAAPAFPVSFARLSVSSFTTLDANNAFGNTNRFTDSVGGQDYDGTGGSLVDYVIDHLKGLGWHRLLIAGDWNTAIDGALASSQSGFTDWYIPDTDMLLSILNLENGGSRENLDYSPFDIVYNNNIWSSVTRQNSTISALTWIPQIFMGSTSPKTNVKSYIICRNHY